MFRLILLSLSLSCVFSHAQPVDFYIKAHGSANIVRGHPLYLGLEGIVTAGADATLVTPSISGLPPGASVQWLEFARCCGNKIYRIAAKHVARITTSPTTPAGTYTLTIKYVTDSGVTRQVAYPFKILTAYAVVSKGTRFPPDTPLLTKSLWEYNMIAYGNRHCRKSDSILETHAWYYDGARVYFQIADYTKNPAFNACALHERDVYRSYIFDMNPPGDVPNWRLFPHGLAMDYVRNADADSRRALSLIQARVTRETYLFYYITAASSREVSYFLDVEMAARSVGPTPGSAPDSAPGSAPGLTPDPLFADRVELLIGHFEQWFISKKVRPQPFMVGLAAEALIDYYAISNDSRVPALLKLACDGLFSSAWDIASQSFRYYNDDITAGVPSPDLNMLIAPMYAWVYRYTAETKYRTWGDRIFNGGVNGAWLGGGKQFSQNYRWSFRYLDWRK